jgi:RNA polymerase sigma factor (sigma-70 family)
MSEEEIIRSLALAGAPQQRALKLFYEQFSQPILRWLVHRGTSADEAKDVFQETFLKVVKNAASFSGSGAAKAWVWQIVRNCLADHQRKHGRQHEVEVAMNEDQWDHLASTTAAASGSSICNSVQTSADECVAAGLLQFGEQLPDRAHALVLQMEGESIEEIGNRIGRTIAATKEYLSQCKKKLLPFISHCRELLPD